MKRCDAHNIDIAMRCFAADGNILWDCVSFVDEIIVSKIAKVGGIAAIVLSCPEKMGACARLSYIFNRCPVYVHEK